ncbi:MAG: radical SAM protein [Lentisphaerota bacterium]
MMSIKPLHRSPISLDDLINGKLPIIICGAGIVGNILSQICEKIGIKITAFCDNNIRKTDSAVNGLEVIHTSKLGEIYPDAIFIISISDIKDIVDQLHDLGYGKWSDCLFIKHHDFANLVADFPPELVSFAFNTCMLCQESFLSPDKLFLRSVDLIITERCSMHCRDCSNLMQYYQHPQDDNLDSILHAIDVLCQCIDEMNEFRLIGGEPLMNRQCHLITRHLIAEPKVRKIIIYTNGTLLPTAEQLPDFISKKVFFMITDYGLISRKLHELVKMLKENKIAYYVHSSGNWTNCSQITPHHRTPEQQQELFCRCCAKNLLTLSDGLLLGCPFIANAIRLKAVPCQCSDYIDLVKNIDGGMPPAEMKEQIRAFVNNSKYFETCDFCNGRSLGDPAIPPAIQTDHPLDYRKY